VSRYPLHACYLYLAYLKDKTEFENRKIKKSFKQ